MPSSFSEWIGFVPDLISIALTAVAVKWLDDFIDDEPYIESFRAGPAYGMLAVLLAAALDFPLTFTLFAACYIVGMFNSLTLKLPSGLPSWAEALLIFGASALLSGLWTALWAVTVIISVQILDDMLDLGDDRNHNRTNTAAQLGIERTGLIFLFCFYLSLVIEPLLSTAVLAVALFVSNVLFTKLAGGVNINASFNSD